MPLVLLRMALAALVLAASFSFPSTAAADHIPGTSCNVTVKCASHMYWPTINGIIKKAKWYAANFGGTSRNDELLGHHFSDVLRGGAKSDVLWGDWDGKNQPTRQRDVIYGGGGSDWIYASHGHNRIYAGRDNDVVSAHFGRGLIDCGPGRDIYHVARTRKHRWKIRNCEKVDYRSERQRGGRGLKPLR